MTNELHYSILLVYLIDDQKRQRDKNKNDGNDFHTEGAKMFVDIVQGVHFNFHLTITKHHVPWDQ